MPVGNITPRTDTLTLTDMLLGSEEYPSSVQQAGEANTGYLLYRPAIAHSFTGGTAHSGDAGTLSTQINGIFLSGGKYDIQLAFSADLVSGATSSVWLQVGTTVVSNVHEVTAGTTVSETFSGVTLAAGLHGAYVYSYGLADVYDVFSATKQYE